MLVVAVGLVVDTATLLTATWLHNATFTFKAADYCKLLLFIVWYFCVSSILPKNDCLTEARFDLQIKLWIAVTTLQSNLYWYYQPISWIDKTLTKIKIIKSCSYLLPDHWSKHEALKLASTWFPSHSAGSRVCQTV